MGMLTGRWLAASGFLLLAPWSMAVGAEPSDFSKGFKQLAGLGLPPLPAGTRWSVFPESQMANLLSDGEMPRGMKGSGWLLPKPETGKRQALMLGAATPIDFDTEAGKERESPGLLGRMLGGGGKKPATTPEADLAKDVKALVAGLAKIVKVDDPFDDDSYQGKEQAKAFGRFLIFAAQIDQAGNTPLANELASALFEVAPGREAIIDAAIDQIASELYEKTTTAFFQTKDWKAYHEELKSLVAKFPRGWENHGAAAILLGSTANRAAGEPAPVPSLDGIELDAKAIESIQWMTAPPPGGKDEPPIPPEIAAQLAGVPAQYRAEYLAQMMGGNGNSFGTPGTWLLKKPDELKEKTGIAGPTLQLGIAALPVLAALADDSYLTIHPNPYNNRYSYFSSDESASEHVQKAYAGMNRPASRGDMAKTLLLATLPDPENENSSADAQTVRDLAVEFWKLHRNDTLEGLALAFLSEGSSGQKTEAALLLAASKNPEDQKSLESHILGELSPASQITTVKAYIQIRKSAAKPFLDRYVKALREELANSGSLEENSDLPWEIREMKSIEPLIKQLESQVSGQSPQARAREIAKGDAKSARAAISAFLESLSDAPPRRRMLALLAGATAAEDPEIRGHFINCLSQASQNEDGENDAPKAERTIPPGEAKAWKTLLSDKREVPAAIARGSNRNGKTLGEMAAIAMEYAEDPEAFESIQTTSVVTGKSYAEIAMPRAQARLNGEPVPSLPDAKKVSPERLREIVSKAGAKPPLEIHPYLKSLTDDERTAWLAWHGEPGDIEVPANVRKLDRVITSREDAYWGLKDMPGTLDIDLNFEISKESVESYINRLAENATAHSRSTGLITSASFPPGLEVITSRMVLPEKPKEVTVEDSDPFSEPENASIQQVFSNVIRSFTSGEPPPEATAVIYAQFSANRTRAATTWWIIGGKPVMQESDDSKMDVLKALAETPADATSLYLQIQVLSRADAEALKESE